MDFKLKEFCEVLSVTRIANIHYYEFTEKYNTNQNSHKFRELVYVDSGVIEINSENYTGNLKKNQLIIHKPDEVHSLTCGEKGAPNVIIIGFECKSPNLDIFSGTPVAVNSELQKLLIDIIREGRNVFLPPYDIPDQKDMKKREDFPFGADQMIKLKLETFFIELIRGLDNEEVFSEPKLINPRTSEIYNYVTENYKQNITLGELCFLFNTNKSTLCYSFKNKYGITLVQYINKLRIKEAKKLMREGKMNLTQISEEIGFSSIHYFSRVFKNYENTSPSDYIETIKARLNS